MFANKELRSNGEDVPVLNQLRRYESFLQDSQTDLVGSYRKVCGNLIPLAGVKNRFAPELQEVMKAIAVDKCNISIQGKVRLVIFGFDKDQRNGENWKIHHKKLIDALGDNLLLRGNSKKFSNGISL